MRVKWTKRSLSWSLDSIPNIYTRCTYHRLIRSVYKVGYRWVRTSNWEIQTCHHKPLLVNWVNERWRNKVSPPWLEHRSTRSEYAHGEQRLCDCRIAEEAEEGLTLGLLHAVTWWERECESEALWARFHPLLRAGGVSSKAKRLFEQ